MVRLWRGWVRDAVFGRSPWLRTPLLRLLSAKVARLEERFDEAFYLRQIAKPRFRDKAARAPALHYLLLGHHQGLSPDMGFDPRHYRQSNFGVPRSRPYLHFLERGGIAGAAGDLAPPDIAAPQVQPAALLIDHGRGGGSTHYLDLYQQRLESEGFRVIRAKRVGGQVPLFVVREGGTSIALPPEDLGAFGRRQGVRRLVVNHLIDLPPPVVAAIPAMATQMGAGYELVLHDYYLACPRVNLVDAQARYCGLAPVQVCRPCLAASAELRSIDPAAWREGSAALLARAERVLAPSRDLADRLVEAFPRASITVIEPEGEPDTACCSVPLSADEPLQLVVIGSLNIPKGFDVIATLAREVQAARAPLRITVLGDAFDPARLRKLGVRVIGRYREEEVAARLAELAPHAAFFPAIWPETWSFTLTHALHQGLPVVAFDIGAIAMRLKRAGEGTLLPHALHADPAALLQALLDLRRKWIAQ